MEPNRGTDIIFQQIAEKDEKLARLFREFTDRLLQESKMKQGRLDNGIFDPLKIGIKDILIPDHDSKDFNIIPGEYDTLCLKMCVCFAFDKWQSKKGFNGIANKTIDYWLSCYRINKGTLILSYAWDDLDFIKKYKNRFDQYTLDPQHTVAVILVSSTGFSLQYINR